MSITVVTQQRDDDCGIAALASLLELPYSEVAQAVRHHDRRGMTVKELQEIAKRLGTPLRRVFSRKGYLHLLHATGILGINWDLKGRRGHFAVMKDGLVIDEGRVWGLEEYFREKGGRPGTLLVKDT